jgi:hypothetical protein
MINPMMKQHLGIYILAAALLIAPATHAQRKKPAKNTPAKTTPKAPQKQAPRLIQKPTAISRGNDTTIKGATLEVYQIYKPEVKIAPKPNFIPTLPPAETGIIPQQYNVPQQALYYTYRSVPLRPLALGKDTTTLPAANYIKAGGGNLSTIYVDAGIGSLKGENWEAAIHAQHISQKGKIEDQRFWHTGLDATGTLHSGGHAWSAALDADYRRYGLYGFDHDAYQFTDKDQRRSYTGVSLKAGVQNEAAGLLGLGYAPWIRLNLYSASIIDAERTIEVAVPVSKKIDSTLSFELGLHGTFTKLTAGTLSQSNNIFQITPGFTFRRSGITGHFGLNPTFGRDGNSYLLPDITAAYQASEQVALKGGWQAVLAQNTFQQLSLKNPFLRGAMVPPQSRTDEVFLAASAGLGHHLSFGARVSWWQYSNLPLFVTTPVNADGRTFDYVVDPRINAFSLQTSARYDLANTFSLGLSGAWYSFYKKNLRHVYGEPSVRLKGDVQWRILKDLEATAYLCALGELYGQDYQGFDRKMKSIIDVGAGAEYRIVSQLSLWINAGNFLNRANQRWLGYDAFGINVYGGLRFRF